MKNLTLIGFGSLVLAMVACGVSGCAGYDTRVSADYTDPSGWSAGTSVDVEKLPSMNK